MAVPRNVHGSFEGISLLLASTFAHNVSNILENVTLEEEASKLRMHFTKELLLSSLIEADNPQLEDTKGLATRVRRRILVVTEVAITLAVLFMLLAGYIAVAVFYTSPRKRPLNLHSDPTTVAGTSSLLGSTSLSTTTFSTFLGYERSRTQGLIQSRVYHLQGGIISEKETTGESIEGRKPNVLSKTSELSVSHPRSKDGSQDDWRPSMLLKRWLLTLLATLIAIATIMFVLRRYAREDKLSQTAFTYQVDLGLFDTSFSPHSVVATLIAVCIGLSWDGIDKPMRILQPYLSLSRKPVVPIRGASLTYQSSYWIWAAAKSASRKHWMLCLITTGTTLSQIRKHFLAPLSRVADRVVIISMAAVFERQTALISRETWDPSHIDTLWVTAPFELLQEPIDFSNPGERTRNFDLDEHMLDSSNIQWLNHALDEILLEAPQLAWTKDEWTFTPLDMQELPNVTVSSESRSGSGRHTSSDSIASPANASFITSAIRSRLQCSPNAVPDSGWLDQAADVFPNRTNEALQGFALPTTLFDGESYNTSVFSARRRLSCCANGTHPGQQAVVAYWSSNSSMIERVDPNFFIQECTYEQLTNGNCTSANAPSDPLSEDGPEDVIVQGSWYRNFTIKWIVGPGVTAKISGANPAANPKVQQISAPYGSADEELLYFTEEPKMAIIDCIMVIENTSASVTVARSSGNVLDYSLLADPQPALDAWDYAWDILYPSPTSYTGRGNVR